MGMFDKDKQFAPDGRLDETYPPGVTDSREGPQFVLWAVEDKGLFESDKFDKPAPMTWLTVSDVLEPDNKKVIGTLSGPIHDKAIEAEPGDFPAVVRSLSVSSDKGNAANVLQWVRVYDDGESGTVTKAQAKPRSKK